MSIKDKLFDDGHGYITFGWIGTIIGLLLFGAMAELYSTREKSRSYYAQKCAEKHEELSAPSSDVAPTSSEKKASPTNAKEEKEPDWCDLAAQQSMAQSTVWINRAAWATVVFTTIGMFLIWRTLVQTGSAAKFAADTLNEARKTTNAVVNEQRPWISIKAEACSDLRVENDSIFIPCKIELKNLGKTPATDVKFSFRKQQRFLKDGPEKSTIGLLANYAKGRTLHHGKPGERRRIIPPNGQANIEDVLEYQQETKRSFLPVVFVSVTYIIEGRARVHESHAAFLIQARDVDNVPREIDLRGGNIPQDKIVFKTLAGNTMT